jgi:hypothetical protein
MDRKGVTGFPWRISLAFLLVALCVPPLAGLAEGFQDTADNREIDSEVERITNSASTVYFGGAGTSLSLDLSILPGYEITLGGEGAEAYCIKITDPNGTETRTFMEHPAARFLNSVTLSGPCTLDLVCHDEPAYGITAVCP